MVLVPRLHARGERRSHTKDRHRLVVPTRREDRYRQVCVHVQVQVSSGVPCRGRCNATTLRGCSFDTAPQLAHPHPHPTDGTVFILSALSSSRPLPQRFVPFSPTHDSIPHSPNTHTPSIEVPPEPWQPPPASGSRPRAPPSPNCRVPSAPTSLAPSTSGPSPVSALARSRASRPVSPRDKEKRKTPHPPPSSLKAPR